MKYSIDVDQKLLQEAKKATGLVTDSETIVFALETLVRLKKKGTSICKHNGQPEQLTCLIAD
ncbi:type II toxin-antitoxin system VapB family antitoxin [Porticoccaceae bacterium]|nr:type II toxin-antitoxin system VapB family antitoxin [Porticoccaceae bacterium]